MIVVFIRRLLDRARPALNVCHNSNRSARGRKMEHNETQFFSKLPLTVSGNVPVAYVSGHVKWRLHMNRSLRHVSELWLKGPHGALIEVDIQNDPIAEPVMAALKKALEAGFRDNDPVPVGDPAELPEKLQPTVDSDTEEESKLTTD